MTLFSLVEMMDTDKVYQKACMAICTRRFDSLVVNVGIQVDTGPYYDHYYGIIDFEL